MSIKGIELHPGHWKNPGSGASSIINEVTEARRVTKRVYEILKAHKVPASYYEDNTSSNQAQNLNNLVKYHNQDRDDLIVSVHFNATGGVTDLDIGTEVLYYNQKALSENIAKAISDASGLKNRGAKQRANLAVLSKTYEPAVLIEVCFVNSNSDVTRYNKHFEKICFAIAQTLAAHIGYKIVETAAATVTPGTYRIYTGVFTTADAAETSKVAINKMFGFYTFIKDFRVWTGTFKTKEAALEAQYKIKTAFGLNPVVRDEITKKIVS